MSEGARESVTLRPYLPAGQVSKPVITSCQMVAGTCPAQLVPAQLLHVLVQGLGAVGHRPG